MTDGFKLSELTALSGAMAATDRIYLVRGSSSLRGLVSQLRITASQVSDSSAFGQSMMTAANAAAGRSALGLAALAVLATVGTTQIDDGTVTLAKMADLAENYTYIGDATNRPIAFGLGAVGKDLMQTATEAAARTVIGVGTISTQDASDVEITGGTAKLTGAALASAATGEVAISAGYTDVGDGLKYQGTKVVGAQGAAIADQASYTGVDNLQVGDVYATVADLNSLRADHNTLLARLRTHGLIAT